MDIPPQKKMEKVHPQKKMEKVEDLKSQLETTVTLMHDGKEMMNYESPSKTSGKEHIVKNYDIMARIRLDYPELAEILDVKSWAEILDVKNKSTDDWLQSFLRTLHCQIAVWKRRPALHKSGDAKKIQHIPYVNPEPETRPRVYVEINGKNVKGGVLVDTGAAVCTITRACATICGLRGLVDETKNEPLIAMDGTPIPVAGFIKDATVKIGDITLDCSFEMVNSDAGVACLLGMSFLRKNKCIIDLVANVLRIPGSSPVPFLPDDSSDQDSVSKSSDSKVSSTSRINSSGSSRVPGRS